MCQGRNKGGGVKHILGKENMVYKFKMISERGGRRARPQAGDKEETA